METLRLMGVAQLFKFNCRYRIRGTCTTVLGIYDIYGFLLLLISSTRVTLFARFCIQDGVILLWFLLVNYRMVLGRIKHYPVSLKARRFVKLHSLLQAVNTKKQIIVTTWIATKRNFTNRWNICINKTITLAIESK